MADDRFDDFYLFAYPRLVAALTFVTGDADLATDAVDEACARAVERLGRGREIDVLEAWVRVVARNVALGPPAGLAEPRHAARVVVSSARSSRGRPVTFSHVANTMR